MAGTQLAKHLRNILIRWWNISTPDDAGRRRRLKEWFSLYRHEAQLKKECIRDICIALGKSRETSHANDLDYRFNDGLLGLPEHQERPRRRLTPQSSAILRGQLVKSPPSSGAISVVAVAAMFSHILTLVNFLQALLVSGIIVCVTYCFMRFTAHCVLWLIEISFKPADDLRQHADRPPVRMSAKTRSSWGERQPISYLGETSHVEMRASWSLFWSGSLPVGWRAK